MFSNLLLSILLTSVGIMGTFKNPNNETLKTPRRTAFVQNKMLHFYKREEINNTQPIQQTENPSSSSNENKNVKIFSSGNPNPITFTEIIDPNETNSNSAGKQWDIPYLLEVIIGQGYLDPKSNTRLFNCIDEYKDAKTKYDVINPTDRPLIEAFVEARDNLEKIKADILSDKNNNEITPEMREKIINSEIINSEHIYNPHLSVTNLPECIRSYRLAFRRLQAADTGLKNLYSKIIRENHATTIDPNFLPNGIATYDRFIKAKKELEKCQDTIQLTAASRDTHQTL